jgi:hypothetical protein
MGKAVSSNQWLTWQAQSTLLYSSSQGSADDIEVVQGLSEYQDMAESLTKSHSCFMGRRQLEDGGHAFRIA